MNPRFIAKISLFFVILFFLKAITLVVYYTIATIVVAYFNYNRDPTKFFKYLLTPEGFVVNASIIL